MGERARQPQPKPASLRQASGQLSMPRLWIQRAIGSAILPRCRVTVWGCGLIGFVKFDCKEP